LGLIVVTHDTTIAQSMELHYELHQGTLQKEA
jgi:ABC-type lipoprotein export system ATPase subunit